MKQASIAELKARLSAYLKGVQAGQSVLVTQGGRPVAVLSPITPKDVEAWTDRLVHLGLVSAPKAKKLPDDFFRVAAVMKDPEGRLLEALLGERQGKEPEEE